MAFDPIALLADRSSPALAGGDARPDRHPLAVAVGPGPLTNQLVERGVEVDQGRLVAPAARGLGARVLTSPRSGVSHMVERLAGHTH